MCCEPIDAGRPLSIAARIGPIVQWRTTADVGAPRSDDLMMSTASTSVALGRRAKALSHPSVRTYLTSGGAVASAGILALGLVAIPPDATARTEVRAVQLTAWTLPEVAEGWGALVREVTGRRTQPAILETSGGGAADVPAAVANTSTGERTVPPRVVASTDVPTLRQEATASALAATPAALALPAPIAAFLGVLVLFGPLIVLVILACPPCAVINFLSYFLPIPTIPLAAAAATATVEEPATVAPELTSDPSSDAPAVPVVSNDKRTGSERGSATETTTSTDQKSAETPKDVTEPVATEPAPKEQGAVDDTEAPVDVTEPTKPAEPPATPRPVVRDSLGAEKKTSDPSHRGTGGRATTEEPAGSRAATAGSSPADSSPTDASSARGSSDGKSDGSK